MLLIQKGSFYGLLTPELSKFLTETIVQNSTAEEYLKLYEDSMELQVYLFLQYHSFLKLEELRKASLRAILKNYKQVMKFTYTLPQNGKIGSL